MVTEQGTRKVVDRVVKRRNEAKARGVPFNVKNGLREAAIFFNFPGRDWKDLFQKAGKELSAHADVAGSVAA